MFVRTKGNAFYKVLERQEVVVRNKHLGHAYLVEDNGHRQFTVSAEEVDTGEQAETIEKLSDCFVAVDKNGKLCEDPMAAKSHSFRSFCNYYKAKKIDVICYLAILTYTGLIFIGKMNEEGEQVLV